MKMQLSAVSSSENGLPLMINALISMQKKMTDINYSYVLRAQLKTGTCMRLQLGTGRPYLSEAVEKSQNLEPSNLKLI